MEESIKYLMEQFHLEKQDIRSYSPLTLAYIGDGIYELYIRTILVEQGNRQANKLQCTGNDKSTRCQGVEQSKRNLRWKADFKRK